MIIIDIINGRSMQFRSRYTAVWKCGKEMADGTII
jgi:hypothetical protein